MPHASFNRIALLAIATIVSVSAAAACSSDKSTPNPVVPIDSTVPNFSAPLPIAIGGTIGAQTYAAGDSTAGGNGQTVQGVACDTSTPTQHIHAHLTLIANGTQRAIPIAIGVDGPFVVSNFVVAARCYYWIHTHDATGIIHIEAPVSTQFTLGQLFGVWGQTLSRTNVGGFAGTVTAYVDSTRYDGDLSALGFTERQQITLIVGAVPDTLPLYAFPSAF